MQNLQRVFIIATILMLATHTLSQERPKIGLALSGGGAKGFCHIGVLKVLEEIRMPIDYITGTSMGSIIGGLYAIGYSAEDLDDLALNTDWASLFSDKVERRSLTMEQKMWDGRYVATLALKGGKIRLPSGLISGQKITRLLNRLTLPAQHIRDFRDFPIPFTCVATNIVTGEAVVLDEGYLSDALRASMAIPTVFTPIKMNDTLMVDGGLVRNLPAEDAINMGADIVIGVDVGAPLLKEEQISSFMSIIDQTTSFQIVASTKEQREYCDYLIVPDMGEFSTFDFDQAAFFIQQGEAAAREMLPQLKALADSLNRISKPGRISRPVKIDSTYVGDMEVRGLEKLSKRLVVTEMDIKTPGWLSIPELEKDIERLYGTQLFERVSYNFEFADDGQKLVIRPVEKSGSLFRAGIHYDSKSDASLLLNTTFRNLGKWGSLVVFDLKLGDDFYLDGQYWRHTFFAREFGFRARGNYSRFLVDYYEEDVRLAQYKVNSYIGEGLLGTLFSTKILFGGGARLEYVEANPSIAPADFEKQIEKQAVLFGTLEIDTYNRAVFPTSGVSMQLRSEYANNDQFDLKSSYWRHYLDFRSVIAVHPKISLLQSLFLGTTSQSEVAFHYLFFLGGMDRAFTFMGQKNSFLGYKVQELTGNNAQFLQLGIQFEFLSNKYILFRWNAGNTFDAWKIDFENNVYLTGSGFTVGTNTFLGPLEFTIMNSSRYNTLTHLNLGYKF